MEKTEIGVHSFKPIYYDKNGILIVPGQYVKLYFADIEINNELKKHIPKVHKEGYMIGKVYETNGEIKIVNMVGHDCSHWLTDCAEKNISIEVITNI